MLTEIKNIIARLETVYEESTLGDIPFIQADLRKLALESANKRKARFTSFEVFAIVCWVLISIRCLQLLFN